MLSYEMPSRYIVRVIAVSAIVMTMTSACKEEVVSEVNNFRFSFGQEYTVVKDGAYCAIEQRDLWMDSQVPPGSDFDEAPYIFLISNGDCNTIIAQVSAIDWDKYQELSDSDFEPTPPGMQFRERLLVQMRTETYVDWIKDYHKMREELRLPLEKLNEMIAGIATKRASDVVLPGSFDLQLSLRSSDRNQTWGLELANGRCQLVSNSNSQSIAIDRFAVLWINLLKLRVFGAEYAPIDEEKPETVDIRSDSLTVNVNGKELVDFNFDTPYESQVRIEKLDRLFSQTAGN